MLVDWVSESNSLASEVSHALEGEPEILCVLPHIFVCELLLILCMHCVCLFVSHPSSGSHNMTALIPQSLV